MTRFWEYFGNHREPQHHHNLQDGLFQIASQTCSLLVQVNNTNNISYGHHATNIQCNNLQSPLATPHTSSRKHNHDQEQLVVLIPPTGKNVKFKPSVSRKSRLGSLLESPSVPDDETDLYNQSCILPHDDSSPTKRWGRKNSWCKPSCIPISVILILIFLVVLLPLLDHTGDTNKLLISRLGSLKNICDSSCSISLVESIPEGLKFPNNTKLHPSTFQAWMNLINASTSTIEIASFYWTLRSADVYPDSSSAEGEQIFQALLKKGLSGNVSLKIAQNAPSQNQPNTDTEFLIKRKAAQVKSVNFNKLLGGGVLHTKLWIIDGQHFYLGSANMDWRSLTQVKELGVVGYNCACIAEDLRKIFNVYWILGDSDKIPDSWPQNLSTNFNMQTPMNLSLHNDTFLFYSSSSPPPFSTKGRTDDINSITNVIKSAEKFVYIAVMDYFPMLIYTSKKKFWPVIDDALKTAAIENKVEIKMLISYWNHSAPSEDNFLKSLMSLSDVYKKVSIEVKRFIVPSNESQQKIPFARVNHNKYMVTDNTAYIGTSNWSGDYFTDTAGIGFVIHDPVFDRNSSHVTIRSELQAVFERDWNSEYAHALV